MSPERLEMNPKTGNEGSGYACHDDVRPMSRDGWDD